MFSRPTAQETPCQDYLVFAQSLCYVTTNSFPLEQNGDHVTEEKFKIIVMKLLKCEKSSTDIFSILFINEEAAWGLDGDLMFNGRQAIVLTKV